MNDDQEPPFTISSQMSVTKSPTGKVNDPPERFIKVTIQFRNQNSADNSFNNIANRINLSQEENRQFYLTDRPKKPVLKVSAPQVEESPDRKKYVSIKRRNIDAENENEENVKRHHREHRSRQLMPPSFQTLIKYSPGNPKERDEKYNVNDNDENKDNIKNANDDDGKKKKHSSFKGRRDGEDHSKSLRLKDRNNDNQKYHSRAKDKSDDEDRSKSLRLKDKNNNNQNNNSRAKDKAREERKESPLRLKDRNYSSNNNEKSVSKTKDRKYPTDKAQSEARNQSSSENDRSSIERNKNKNDKATEALLATPEQLIKESLSRSAANNKKKSDPDPKFQTQKNSVKSNEKDNKSNFSDDLGELIHDVENGPLKNSKQQFSHTTRESINQYKSQKSSNTNENNQKVPIIYRKDINRPNVPSKKESTSYFEPTNSNERNDNDTFNDKTKNASTHNIVNNNDTSDRAHPISQRTSVSNVDNHNHIVTKDHFSSSSKDQQSSNFKDKYSSGYKDQHSSKSKDQNIPSSKDQQSSNFKDKYSSGYKDQHSSSYKDPHVSNSKDQHSSNLKDQYSSRSKENDDSHIEDRKPNNNKEHNIDSNDNNIFNSDKHPTKSSSASGNKDHDISNTKANSSPSSEGKKPLNPNYRVPTVNDDLPIFHDDSNQNLHPGYPQRKNENRFKNEEYEIISFPPQAPYKVPYIGSQYQTLPPDFSHNYNLRYAQNENYLPYGHMTQYSTNNEYRNPTHFSNSMYSGNNNDYAKEIILNKITGIDDDAQYKPKSFMNSRNSFMNTYNDFSRPEQNILEFQSNARKPIRNEPFTNANVKNVSPVKPLQSEDITPDSPLPNLSAEDKKLLNFSLDDISSESEEIPPPQHIEYPNQTQTLLGTPSKQNFRNYSPIQKNDFNFNIPKDNYYTSIINPIEIEEPYHPYESLSQTPNINRNVHHEFQHLDNFNVENLHKEDNINEPEVNKPVAREKPTRKEDVWMFIPIENSRPKKEYNILQNYSKVLSYSRNCVKSGEPFRTLSVLLTQHKFEHLIMTLDKTTNDLVGIFSLNNRMTQMKKLWGDGPEKLSASEVDTTLTYNQSKKTFSNSNDNQLSQEIDAVYLK